MFTEMQLIRLQNLIRAEQVRVYNRMSEYYRKNFLENEMPDRIFEYNFNILKQEQQELEQIKTIIEQQIENILEQQNPYKELYLLSNKALRTQDQYIEQTISYDDYQNQMSDITKQINRVRKQMI